MAGETGRAGNYYFPLERARCRRRAGRSERDKLEGVTRKRHQSCTCQLVKYLETEVPRCLNLGVKHQFLALVCPDTL